jgi:transposase-like protein
MEKKMIQLAENLMKFMVWFRKHFGCRHCWAYTERVVLCGHVMARHSCMNCGKDRYVSYSETLYSNED